MTGSSPAAVIVLLCGLPAAGKTTLAKHLTSSGSTHTRLYERISFDDLYEQAVNHTAEAKTSEFHPDIWKICQQDMVVRVTKRIEQQSAVITSNPMQQLVVLVDDNFQYRSLRKRFFHLATDLNCGFAVLYMDVPTAICRERNATRSTIARVPDDIYTRMEAAFEAPNSSQDPWEINTLEWSEGVSDADIGDLMDLLIQQALNEAERHRLQLKDRQLKEEQRRQNQLVTQQSVHHLVDLQLRQWISAKLRSENNLPPNQTKAQYASQLNQRRKTYLAFIKSNMLDVDAGDTAEQVAVLLVRRFQEQE